MIDSYTKSLETEMVNLFVLVDIRHKPMQIDLDFINEMGEEVSPFSIVKLTKADKLSKGAAKTNLLAYKQSSSRVGKSFHPCSSPPPKRATVATTSSPTSPKSSTTNMP